MLPSPSLGPPLLSESWSPPLFCGIPAVELDELEPPELDAEAAGADVGIEELLLDPPPQPAAAMARAATTAARFNRRLRKPSRRHAVQDVSQPLGVLGHREVAAGDLDRLDLEQLAG